jgi:hypothetical protein
MQKGEIIRYVDMTNAEGFILQRGMNWSIPGKNYHVILMSVRKNAPYADQWLPEENAIIYEGHDVQTNYNFSELPPDQVDQPLRTPTGSLTENGKFFNAAMKYRREKHATPDIVKVYEKLKGGIWVYNGYFYLVDAWVEKQNRKVFKFRLEMIDSNEEEERLHDTTTLELEHNRLIPTDVKTKVWARDHGKCVECGSTQNLHFDHIIPFSKGGSSKDPNNIQLLCQTCNLRKHDNIL